MFFDWHLYAFELREDLRLYALPVMVVTALKKELSVKRSEVIIKVIEACHFAMTLVATGLASKIDV